MLRSRRSSKDDVLRKDCMKHSTTLDVDKKIKMLQEEMRRGTDTGTS